MILDYALSDNSAEIARRILNRGVSNMEKLLFEICGGNEFVYVACPDFSISLRQRRLIIGLPIGGYVKWRKEYRFFPIELDVNSCGVHILKLPSDFDLINFEKKMFDLKRSMQNQEVILKDRTLKWNFSRRNHFINIYINENNEKFLVAHAAGETVLFDWEYLHKKFNVLKANVNGREIPYILGDDVDEYFRITENDNAFFFERHKYIFDILLNKEYEMIYADQHFGMLSQGELVMGCSKIKPNTIFPILTRPFENILLAKACNTPQDILSVTGGYALVPHGLGMTLPKGVIDVLPNDYEDNYVDIIYNNGCKMTTDTLEYAGIDYRQVSVIPEMKQKLGFEVVGELKPVLCTKI